MRLFHISASQIALGTELQPGRWGQAFRTQYVFNDMSQAGAQAGWRLASELIIEEVRRNEFSQLPSRFNCLFAHDDEQMARRWVANGGSLNNTHFLYAVELVQPNAPTHRAALNLMSAVNRFTPAEAFYTMTERIARAYWNGDDIQIPEIVTASPLRIVQQLT